MKRSTRKLMAEETVAILDRGEYRSRAGRRVDIAADVHACLDATRHLPPETARAALRTGLGQTSGDKPTRFEVAHETTLAGIDRLREEGAGLVVALNFASAKNPGGGFLTGSLAQEESLAISSALYASQLRAAEFYDRHRQSASLLYSDAMILSPACPIFRDDSGALRDEPICATFLTSPAPNAGAIAAKRSPEADRIESTLRDRAELILAVAASAGATDLVLGAWGCGVFRNDPDLVAAAFAGPLRVGLWAGRFDRVRFSVLDPTADRSTVGAFERAFLD